MLSCVCVCVRVCMCVCVCVIVRMCRYWDTLLEMFYPRFEYILLQNIHSIRDCEPQRLGHIDVRPHYVPTLLSLCLSVCLSVCLSLSLSL